MSNCHYTKKVEAYFDGVAHHEDSVREHLAQCPACTAHRARLETLRAGVRAVAQRQDIGDAQFPAFMAGIQEGMARRTRRPREWLAAASLTLAAMVIAYATFVTFTGTAAPVKATEVISTSTDLEGATVNWYDSDEGVTTVWVNPAKGDIE